MYKNIDLARKDISYKLMIFKSDKKKTVEKGHVWKESGVMTQRRREEEVGTLLLGNDKNNGIADIVLSYF